MNEALLKDREILIVEDEPLLRKRLVGYLEKMEGITKSAKNLAEAKTLLQSTQFDYALLDIHLPDGNGLDLLRQKQFPDSCGVVVMTADGGVKSAVEALKLGAREYLVKPFDFPELLLVFERSREVLQQVRIQEFKREKELKPEAGFFFGSSLTGLKSKLEKITETDFKLTENLPPVLISGETGTGKSSLARWIHYIGPRSDHPLVEINCATLSDSLAESELFGHERGAFTDAREGRIGLFEAAHKGTLFLDEISSLSPIVQSKVLTAIEDRIIRRVGGTRYIPVDVRIIVASLHDLQKRVQEGLFREDLYHRLDLLRIYIEPLKNRKDDIVELAGHLLNKLALRYGKSGAFLSTIGEKRLLSHDWPGNVRELSHELERSLILGEEGPVNLDSLADSDGNPVMKQIEGEDWLVSGWEIPDEGFYIEEAINRFIHLALDQSEGNVSLAARLLNVPRDYIRYRLKNKA